MNATHFGRNEVEEIGTKFGSGGGLNQEKYYEPFRPRTLLVFQWQ